MPRNPEHQTPMLLKWSVSIPLRFFDSLGTLVGCKELCMECLMAFVCKFERCEDTRLKTHNVLLYIFPNGGMDSQTVLQINVRTCSHRFVRAKCGVMFIDFLSEISGPFYKSRHLLGNGFLQ